MDYMVGDYIKVVNHKFEKEIIGKTGRVINVSERGDMVGVEFPQPLTHGHDLNGIGKPSCCFIINLNHSEIHKQNLQIGVVHGESIFK